MRSILSVLALATVVAAFPDASSAQGLAPLALGERVTYHNPVDGTTLSGMLVVPEGKGPFPGVVLLTLAGADELIGGLNRLGWAVLYPVRRGMGTPEHFLQAGFQNLSNDVWGAMEYFRSRPEVDEAVIGLVAQGGESMAGVMAAITPPFPAFLVLISTTGLQGYESFAIEQRWLAGERKYDAQALLDLEEFLARLTEIILNEPSPALRAARSRAFMYEPGVGLPRNTASFPLDTEGQVRFFSSRWWRDYFLFRPDSVLAQVRSPVLVVMGERDPLTPYQQHIPQIRRSLEEAPTDDVTVCLLPGRTQHSFSKVVQDVIEEWLVNHVSPAAGTVVVGRANAGPPEACLEAPAAIG
jgi:pimeloyl-ACP methyl ester carboxylesterase